MNKKKLKMSYSINICGMQHRRIYVGGDNKTLTITATLLLPNRICENLSSYQPFFRSTQT